MQKFNTSLLLALALAGTAQAQLSEGEVAPPFPIKGSLDNSVKDFKALRGKVLMLDFFATG